MKNVISNIKKVCFLFVIFISSCAFIPDAPGYFNIQLSGSVFNSRNNEENKILVGSILFIEPNDSNFDFYVNYIESFGSGSDSEIEIFFDNGEFFLLEYDMNEVAVKGNPVPSPFFPISKRFNFKIPFDFESQEVTTVASISLPANKQYRAIMHIYLPGEGNDPNADYGDIPDSRIFMVQLLNTNLVSVFPGEIAEFLFDFDSLENSDEEPEGAGSIIISVF